MSVEEIVLLSDDAPIAEHPRFGSGTDELGQVSRKITQVGQQLRGVHEIFSTMRENMNSVMAGMEDGLLLFTKEARAVMVSPAAEKFLGAPAGTFLGRRVNEIFPPGHPLYDVLQVQGDELSEIAAETGLGVGNDGNQPVGIGLAVHVMNLVGSKQRVVDALDHFRHRVDRIQTLIRIHFAGGVGIARHLPT